VIPVVQLGTPATVALDAAVWAAWSFVVGTAVSRAPLRVLAHDTWVTRSRRWERAGRCYERWGVRTWKDRVPEFGAFGGGWSKRRLPGRGPVALQRFAAETRRAEYAHWAIAWIWPVFVLWNPPSLVAAMLAYAFLANVPCIAIQRYNRLRVARILDRAGRRTEV
jgi:glycosyl-4,4'-diaponeurosporenoate acyltransferase